MIVIDASAVLDLLFRNSRGEDITDHLTRNRWEIAAPHLIDLEVLQTLKRYNQQNEISDERAGQALEDLATLGIRRYPHAAATARIWELRHNFSAYDAAYVTLAESLDTELLTSDLRLARSARGLIRLATPS